MVKTYGQVNVVNWYKGTFHGCMVMLLLYRPSFLCLNLLAFNSVRLLANHRAYILMECALENDFLTFLLNCDFTIPLIVDYPYQ